MCIVPVMSKTAKAALEIRESRNILPVKDLAKF